MHASLFIAVLVASTTIPILSCEAGTSMSEETVREVTSKIVVGMERVQVEGELSRLGLTHSYVPREYLQVIQQDTFEGAPLSGRFDVLSPFDAEGGRKSEAAIHIELGMDERVVNVRVEGFGMR